MCRHLLPALYAWAVRALYTSTRQIATQFPGQRCIDDLTTESSFVSQGYVSLMCLTYCLTCYPWVFVQIGIGRRPVDWCMN